MLDHTKYHSQPVVLEALSVMCLSLFLLEEFNLLKKQGEQQQQRVEEEEEEVSTFSTLSLLMQVVLCVLVFFCLELEESPDHVVELQQRMRIRRSLELCLVSYVELFTDKPVCSCSVVQSLRYKLHPGLIWFFSLCSVKMKPNRRGHRLLRH